MPNYIHCRLTAPSVVLDSLAVGENAVDFNTVIPTPEVMRSQAPTHVEDWARIAVGDIHLPSFFAARHENPADAARRQDWGSASNALRQSNVARLIEKGPFPKDFKNADFEALLQQMRALREFGHANWYDWSCEKWGTKWNAMRSQRISPERVEFETAWSAPLPVLQALSERFHEVEIRLEWADEDFGANTGDVTVIGGQITRGGRHENYSPAAHTLAFGLVHGNELPEDCASFDPQKGLTWKEDDEEVPVA